MKEQFPAKVYVPKIAKWIEDTINEVKANIEDNCSTYWFKLDGVSQISIGWAPGFGTDDDSIIVDPKNVELAKNLEHAEVYALCIKVSETGDDYEWLNMPFNTEKAHRRCKDCVAGDVYDTDSSLPKDATEKDYRKIARGLLRAYKNIRHGLAIGTLTYHE